MYSRWCTLTSRHKLKTLITPILVTFLIFNSQPSFLGFRSDHRVIHYWRPVHLQPLATSRQFYAKRLYLVYWIVPIFDYVYALRIQPWTILCSANFLCLGSRHGRIQPWYIDILRIIDYRNTCRTLTVKWDIRKVHVVCKTCQNWPGPFDLPSSTVSILARLIWPGTPVDLGMCTGPPAVVQQT